MKKIMFTILLALTSFTALAKPQTITLDLPTMDCAMCPITVKMALDKVEGVIESAVTLDSKSAVVTFEDTQTSVVALVQATTNAGYISTLKQEK
ncbi:MAG: mercury resistance system periplasmic binding protein MerP [Gammaproteobacteria bacterium]|nr:mercury resistance system periplasmic binding protein MerP [Gammaproteobacteria bacterium]MBL4728641.1 mercury resistance system periplasmic binding protein MerP [Gammaproteobacteria bacterium]